MTEVVKVPDRERRRSILERMVPTSRTENGRKLTLTIHRYPTGHLTLISENDQGRSYPMNLNDEFEVMAQLALLLRGMGKEVDNLG